MNFAGKIYCLQVAAQVLGLRSYAVYGICKKRAT